MHSSKALLSYSIGRDDVFSMCVLIIPGESWDYPGPVCPGCWTWRQLPDGHLWPGISWPHYDHKVGQKHHCDHWPNGLTFTSSLTRDAGFHLLQTYLQQFGNAKSFKICSINLAKQTYLWFEQHTFMMRKNFKHWTLTSIFTIISHFGSLSSIISK